MKDRGSILPLVAGGMFLVLSIIFGVSASASLLIERARLFTLADGAALSAAQGFAPRYVTRTSGGARVFLTDREVETAVLSYLQHAGPGPLEGLRVDRVDAISSDVVVVTLSSLWSPPLISDFFPASLRIAVTAQAQSLIR